MRLEVNTSRYSNKLAIHIDEPFLMVTVGTKERGRISYDAAVRLLLVQAEECNQEPRMRYGDGEPATYMGVTSEGALVQEEAAILIMPTKYKQDTGEA